MEVALWSIHYLSVCPQPVRWGSTGAHPSSHEAKAGGPSQQLLYMKRNKEKHDVSSRKAKYLLWLFFKPHLNQNGPEKRIIRNSGNFQITFCGEGLDSLECNLFLRTFLWESSPLLQKNLCPANECTAVSVDLDASLCEWSQWSVRGWTDFFFVVLRFRAENEQLSFVLWNEFRGYLSSVFYLNHQTATTLISWGSGAK